MKIHEADEEAAIVMDLTLHGEALVRGVPDGVGVLVPLMNELLRDAMQWQAPDCFRRP
ncbi:hypothetical protein [Mycobacteroides abscessus]|uniref:hypothetical protein n=1 Tax=Mycobacteroides abscessus TaxID=36809 RepID=UPI0009D06731|nr:hypothetical protein [Mycobacteroides abscessus]MDO3206617.1 hypothetical protein [Mycobacteroides abscessus subsp. massiliense]SKI81778.1 Uncharacterised protein [Mycobacteroides abscessus subsp. massiliense]SKR74120.1 Uncharacterised protein [Mycobacteroides abscessus subsp. massiliense]SKS39109.1 Uncharacterised protein [Mycobacteroides abscessus subsp. massiliense]SKS90728.1 Uncharacterised protein [Mycobacteroides abscessus subsp. massiliense]